MPKHTYSLEPGGPKQLALQFAGGGLKVTFDDREIGSVGKLKDLKTPRTFELGDGSSVQVQLAGGFPPELRVTRNGEPLPGSASAPETRVKMAGVMLLGCALGALFFGLLDFGAEPPAADDGMGWVVFVEPAVLALLGALVIRLRSLVALAVAMGLMALEVPLLLLDGEIVPAILLLGVVLLLSRAFGAFGQLRAKRAAEQRREAA